MDEERAARLVRVAALALPGAVEEPAWLGVRWRVRGRTFAHVLVVRDGRPPAYARALAGEQHCVVAFKSGGGELAALTHAGPPLYGVPSRPGWVLLSFGGGGGDGDVDHDELRELLTDSWRLVAPTALVARLPGTEVTGPH